MSHGLLCSCLTCPRSARQYRTFLVSVILITSVVCLSMQLEWPSTECFPKLVNWAAGGASREVSGTQLR
jgi:hypothetical protein